MDEQDAPDLDRFFQDARAAHRRGDLEVAQLGYLKVLSLKRDHAPSIHALGLIALRSGDVKKAEMMILEAIQIDPHFGDAYFNLANIYRQMGDLASARHNDRRAIELMPDDAQAHNNQGITYQALGQTEAAIAAFGRAVALEPSFADAHHNLGLARHKSQDLHAALDSFRSFAALRPDSSLALTRVAEVAGALGRFDEVVASYGQAIALEPGVARNYHRRALAYEALNQGDLALADLALAMKLAPGQPEYLITRARVLRGKGNHAEALADLEALLQIEKRHAEALFQRGLVLLDLQRAAEAETSLRQALDLDPTKPLYEMVLGDTLVALKRPLDALTSYDRALLLDSAFAEVLNNKAALLFSLKRYDEALQTFDAALALNPKDALLHMNRGRVLLELRRYRQAADALASAIEINPALAGVYRSLGETYRALGRSDAALGAFEQALTLDPNDALSHAMAGHVLVDAKDYAKAVVHYDHALALDDQFDFLPGLRLVTKLHVCNWQGFDEEWSALALRVERGDKVLAPFPSLILSSSAKLQLRVAQIFAKARFSELARLPNLALHRGHQKIRVGYFSADFFEHATTHLMIDLFERHDRSRFEFIAISFGPEMHDAMRSRLEKAFDQFHDVTLQSDEEIALLARALEIDIAVDLKGYTTLYRPGIFALRAAPVQVSYLGYPGTTAMHEMDYVIADEVLVPRELRSYYTERIAYLPDSYQPNDTGRKIAERVFTKSELGLPQSGFVFCCFNNNFKILPRVFDCWMQILSEVEGSVLWLLADNHLVPENLRREAERRGIDGARLIFAPRIASADHLARHRAADLFLDTLPYNAHTTTSDALWAGLPVLTLAGESFASRVAASLLHAADLKELVTMTESDYVSLAVRLAREPDLLSSLKQRLSSNRLALRLFDIARFTAAIEALFLVMHQRSQDGAALDDIGPL